jgi:protein-tyrosine phosphatase
MEEIEPFVDIHCHLLPDIDDGSKSWNDSLAMARMAVADGTSTIICTPHQLGSYVHNTGDQIRSRTRQLKRLLARHEVPLQVFPGADVRIDPDMVPQIVGGQVLTLADRGKHVLLELPHEMYVPLEVVLESLARQGITGILSHPERNQGLLRQPQKIKSLVDRGCLMQVTADSIMGMFGSRCRDFAEQMLVDGLVHFVASDAHGSRSRRPLLRRAFELVCQLVGTDAGIDLFRHNPERVVGGKDVPMRPPKSRRSTFFPSWFGWRRAG